MKNQVTMRVKEGKIVGVKESSKFSGAEYFAFYGVPYAEPPIGNLRFRDPVKVKQWNGTRNATVPKGGCTQFSLFEYRFSGTEDCLYTNIYTPSLPTKDGTEPLKAVVVNIHPGGNYWGSPDPKDHGSPNFVMHHDVVYVCIGYRLHILGFLNLKMEECPGNQGVKDVMMALEWIKENIQRFNGDPNNITVMGASSSSILIHVLLLHHGEKKLFHKVIMQGLHLFNCVTYVPKEPVKMAFEFGRLVGFRGDNPKKLLAYLKSIPADLLIPPVREFFIKHNKDIVKVFPTIGFMPEEEGEQNVRKAIKTMTRVPLLFGVCEREGAIAFLQHHREKTEERFKTSIRQNQNGWAYNLDDQTLDSIFAEVEAFYSKGDPEVYNSMLTKIDILSDACLSDVYPTLLDVVSAELPSSVFVYKFQYDGELNGVKNLQSIKDRLPMRIEGTFHCDDYCYWAYMFNPKTEQTRRFVNTYTKLFSTFAKTGNPNYEGIEVQWEPTTPERPYYLSLNDPLKSVEGKLNGEKTEFWENLRRKYKTDDID